MANNYTDEKNAQVVIFLLKEYGIRKVIASPGTTNMALIVSIQSDPFFEIYSSVDERSAAYIACGMAAESGEPVVISCTGATASRNYLSGLTEAYYRKLPVLAITSTQHVSRIGHHVAQVIDRSVIQNDVAKLSVTLPVVKDDQDLWDCEIKVNKALSELKRNGGGPVHINLPTSYSRNFNVPEL
jgi:2-succinyl-5-enolpyruvyl-6-hydroxy-3-cyclohexene-1-carboxylate synthase